MEFSGFKLDYLMPSVWAQVGAICAGVVFYLILRPARQMDASVFRYAASLSLFVAGLSLAGFIAGFLGPLYFAPSANQGPLLGIFFTGPFGAVLGLIFYLVYFLVKREPARVAKKLMGAALILTSLAAAGCTLVSRTESDGNKPVDHAVVRY